MVGSKDVKSDKNTSVSIRFVHFKDEVIADEKGNERRNRIILKSDDHADISSLSSTRCSSKIVISRKKYYLWTFS